MCIKKLKSGNGQSLSEYGLTIGLVVIVGIASLTILGQQTSDLLGNTITKRKPTLISTAFQAGPNTAFLEAFPDISIKSPSGKTYVLPNYPASSSQFKELIDSTGSDGTQRLAAFLKALSEIQDPELLSQEERDILRGLARQGFRLSEYQNKLEESASNGFQLKDEKTGQLQKLVALNALHQINLLNSLSIGNVEAGVNQESRKEYFQKNPELKALVYDAAKKLSESGQASAKTTINVISQMNRLDGQLASGNGDTISLCDQLGCRTLSPSETRERYKKEYNDFFTNAKFQFGGLVETSKKGSATLCVNSATGRIDPQGKDCV